MLAGRVQQLERIVLSARQGDGVRQQITDWLMYLAAHSASCGLRLNKANSTLRLNQANSAMFHVQCCPAYV